jgi:hypothetical protein
MRLVVEALRQCRREARFADPGFTGDQDHLAFPYLCPGPTPKQQFKLVLPPDEGGQAGRAQRLEAALHGGRPKRHPGRCWPGDALEVSVPEVLKLEEIAEKPSGTLSDDNGIWLGHRLQARSQIGRLTHDPAFLGLP